MMKKEKFNNYFTSLSILFLFEGIQQSLLYPIAPFLLQQDSNAVANRTNFNSTSLSGFGGLEGTSQDKEAQMLELNLWKGQLSFYYGLFILIFQFSQFIGIMVWSTKVDYTNIKHCIIAMIFMQTAAIIVISLQFSLTVTYVMRAIQGFFSTPVAVVKLTIDNKFNPRRDMQKVVDLAGLWYLGLAIGCSLTSMLSKDFLSIESFTQNPYLLSAIVNAIIQAAAIIILLILYPQFSEKKIMYRKVQSTLFFQSVFFLSQNDCTQTVTRHQRTRSTFDKMLLKEILWKERNLLFAVVYQGIIYFTFYGFFDIFCIYCFTVLDIQNELYFSNIYCLSFFAVFIYEMLFIDVNYFEETGDEPRKTNKDLISGICLGLLSFLLLYLLRFFTQFNHYIFLVLVCSFFLYYSVCACHLISQSHYLVEQVALQCGEDSDHARNLAQINAHFSKTIGTFILCLCAAFNYWQYNHIYFGRLSFIYCINLPFIDFVYVYGMVIALLLLALMLLNCLDNQWKEPDRYGYRATTKVYNSDLDSSQNEVFA